MRVDDPATLRVQVDALDAMRARVRPAHITVLVVDHQVVGQLEVLTYENFAIFAVKVGHLNLGPVTIPIRPVQFATANKNIL